MSKHMRGTDPSAGARGRRGADEREHAAEGPGRVRRRHPVRVALVAVLVVLLVSLACFGALFAMSARSVKGEATEAAAQAQVLAQALAAGDAQSATQAYGKLEDTVGHMDRQTSGVLWVLASGVPVVGVDVGIVRELASVAHELVTDALGPVTEAAGELRLTDIVADHAIDLSLLERVSELAKQTAPVVHEASERVGGLTGGVIPEVRDVRSQVSEALAQADTFLSDADATTGSLLAMLGQGGTRTYLIAALGNSEIRASGGMPGAIAVMHVTDGAFSLDDFSSVHGVQSRAFEAGISAEVTGDEVMAFGAELATDAARSTSTPDFSRASEILSELWEGGMQEHVNGVVALDPVFLGRILGLTGPITASDGTVVDGENCAAELLSNVYWRYGYETNANELEDAFFADVAMKAYDALFAALPDIDLASLGQVLLRSVAERRLQVWMAEPSEEQLAERVGASGKIVADDGVPTLGIYLNDDSWNKLSWYLGVYYDLERGEDTADGRVTYDVAVHLTNSITEDEASRAPSYISQMYQTLKRSPSDMVVNAFFMAPTGGSIEGFERHPDAAVPADKTIEDAHFTVYERDTWRSRLNILGGGDSYVTFTLIMPPGTATTPRVQMTPLCHD